MHNIYDIAPYGFLFSLIRFTDANLFLVLYALVAYYFSNKMARLIILLGPVASALGGAAIGIAFDQLLLRVAQRAAGAAIGIPPPPPPELPIGDEEEEDEKPAEGNDPPTDESVKAKMRRKKDKEAGKKRATDGAGAALRHARALGKIGARIFDEVGCAASSIHPPAARRDRAAQLVPPARAGVQQPSVACAPFRAGHLLGDPCHSQRSRILRVFAPAVGRPLATTDHVQG